MKRQKEQMKALVLTITPKESALLLDARTRLEEAEITLAAWRRSVERTAARPKCEQGMLGKSLAVIADLEDEIAALKAEIAGSTVERDHDMTDLATTERIKALEYALNALVARVEALERESTDLQKRVEVLDGPVNAIARDGA